MNARKSSAIVALAVGLLAWPAAAGSVDVDFVSAGLGRSVQVVLNGDSGNVFSGQLIHNLSDGTGEFASFSGNYITYCTELTEYVATNPTTFEGVALNDGPESGPMGDIKAAAIGRLFSLADGLQYSDDPDTADFAAAFQIAVWEVVYDYDGTLASLDTADGNLEVNGTKGAPLPSGIGDALASMFAAVGFNTPTDYSAIRIVTADGFQDQIVLIPLPPAVALGMAGLGLVGIRRAKRGLARA